MPSFSYRSLDLKGHVHTGTLEASHLHEVTHILIDKGQSVITVYEQRPLLSSLQTLWRSFTPVHRSPLAPRFAQSMAELLTSGLPLIQAIDHLSQSSTNQKEHNHYTNLARYLRQGDNLSTAIDKTFTSPTGCLSPVFLAMVRAGEQSGDLATTFTTIARYEEERAATRQRIRRALRYPLLLLGLALGVITFMMLTIVPQITGLLKTLGGELPLATRMLITTSTLATSPAGISVIALLLVAIPTLILLRLHHAPAIGRLLSRLPLIGGIRTSLTLSRVYGALGLLIRSHGPTISTMMIIRPLMTTPYEKKAIDAIITDIKTGHPFSYAMRHISSPTDCQCFAIAEHSGKIDQALLDLAAHHDQSAKNNLQVLTSVIEPTLTVLIGLILMWVTLAVLSPLYGRLAGLAGG